MVSSPTIHQKSHKIKFIDAHHFWWQPWHHAPDWQLISRSWQFIQHVRRNQQCEWWGFKFPRSGSDWGTLSTTLRDHAQTTKCGRNLSYFSWTLQQPPNNFELTVQGHWVQPFEALHSSTQVQCLQCSTVMSPPHGGGYWSQTQAQANFKDNSASGNSHHTSRYQVAKPAYRTWGFRIQHNHRCHWPHCYDYWIIGTSLSAHVEEPFWLS